MSPDEFRAEFRDIRTPSESVRDPESGLFARIREWNDLFPWLKLGRTLRLAGSPPLVLFTFLCLGLWWLGESWILAESAPRRELWSPEEWSSDDAMFGAVVHPMETVTRLAYMTSPSSIYQLPARTVAWRFLVGTCWSLLVWTPVALLLTRQGGLLTAGRPMMSLRAGLRHAFSRMPRAWLTALVPSACLAMIALMIFVIGKVCQWVEGVAVIEIALAIVLALIAITCGLLAFGSHFAIPLGWAALANEQNPDPLDSLSRGYEYLLRRPLQLAAYLILSFLMIFVIWALVSGIAAAATSVAEMALVTSGGPPSLIGRVTTVLSWFPVAVAVTLGWGLVGGVYLLLRCDAGGQEVEDIWMAPLKPPPPLPSLPSTG